MFRYPSCFSHDDDEYFLGLVHLPVSGPQWKLANTILQAKNLPVPFSREISLVEAAVGMPQR
jgi:hypothetical protein